VYNIKLSSFVPERISPEYVVEMSLEL
jgi:hypothetical protein